MTDDEMAQKFYAKHRGGSGNVILAIAVSHFDTDDHMNGIFSNIENAESWSEKIGENWSCVFVPMVVDVPEYGNSVEN